MLSLYKIVNIIASSRTIERSCGHYFLKANWLNPLEQANGTRLLKLENPLGLASRKEFQSVCILQVNVCNLNIYLIFFQGCFFHPLNKGQIAQAQKVHLKQSIALHTVGIILGDIHVLTIFERYLVCQVIVAHHNAGCVDRRLTGMTFDFFSNIKGLLIFQLTVDNLTKGHIFLISRGQTIAKADFLGNIGQLILWQTEALENIANGLLGSESRVGYNLSRMHAAIAVANIADKLWPVNIRNIDINIGHCIAL